MNAIISFLLLYLQAPNVIIVTDKREALWWHMDTLKTNAPDRCSEDALFDMTVVSNTKEGREVMFKSHIMDQYLIVTQDDSDSGDPQEPQFKFELSVSVPCISKIANSMD